MFHWEITNSPYKSEFLEQSIDFGACDPCYLLDQYSGRRPALINDEFIAKGSIQFKVYPCALLDSNLASQVHAVVNGGKVNDGFRDLLRFLTEKKWDFGLYFYYIEHYCKSDKADIFRDNATTRTTALLKLHSMDATVFLNENRIEPNPIAVEHYLSSSNSRSLDEVAVKRVNNFMEKHDSKDTNERVGAIEVAIMKMFLIRKFEQPRLDPGKQWELLMKFLANDLDVILAREAHLALHYFHDKAGKLLGIQTNTPFERAISIIRSTAWDMYLLRFPELFFSGSPDELCVNYIATQEKSLARLAKLFFVESISSSTSGRLQPIIGYNMNELPEFTKGFEYIARPQSDRRKVVPVGLRDAMTSELRRILPAT